MLGRGALFFITAACYFCNMVIWLNTIKYSSNWSPLLPGWVSRWLNGDVSVLKYIQMSNIWLLLLFKMMLCFDCGPKLWSTTWHLLSLAVSPFKHIIWWRVGKVRPCLSPLGHLHMNPVVIGFCFRGILPFFVFVVCFVLFCFF